MEHYFINVNPICKSKLLIWNGNIFNVLLILKVLYYQLFAKYLYGHLYLYASIQKDIQVKPSLDLWYNAFPVILSHGSV